MRYPNFIGGSYTALSINAAQERTVNLIPDAIATPGASTPMALVLIPGVTELSMAALGNGRAHFWEPATEREFAVIGGTFYEVAQSGALTSRGTVALDSNPATISSNGDGGGQLLITSGGNAYYFVLATNVFTQIAALNGIATMGAHLDGYGLVFDAASSTVYLSDLLDFATWDPTQFFQRSIAGDPWVSMIVSNRLIRLDGAQTSEAWYDAGEFPIPFVPHSAGLIEYGCAAPFSPEVVGGGACWLGATANGQGKVLRATGFSPEVISTSALEVALASYPTIADAIGDTYEDKGHTFYLLYFPTAGKTWCWDSATQLWHERTTFISELAQEGVWRPCYHAFAFGEHRTLDLQTGSVYRLSQSVYTDVDDANGNPRPIRWMRQAPNLGSENELLLYPAIELDLQPGIGLPSGQGVDPQVMMQMSNDGGHTWGNELWRSAGAQGEYSRRVRWLRCGAARRRVFRFIGTDPVPWRILNAYLPGFREANPGLGRAA